MPFWCYILHCRGGVFYTGHTDDLDYRVAQYESGAIKGFASKYLPVELVWSQEFPTRQEAFEAERRIKGWSRKKKLALIRGDWEAISFHARSKGGPSTSSGRADLEVASDVLDLLQGQAAAVQPNECCGILLGEGDTVTVTAIHPAKNVHPTPHTHFEIDPQTLVDAHRQAREGAPQVIGYYHSHPAGPARPSATDRAQAAGDDRIWAIIAPDATTWWRDTPDGFVPLSLATTDG